jgi:hypothetical protein
MIWALHWDIESLAGAPDDLFKTARYILNTIAE